MTGIFFLAGLLSCQQDVKETRLMSYNVKTDKAWTVSQTMAVQQMSS